MPASNALPPSHALVLPAKHLPNLGVAATRSLNKKNHPNTRRSKSIVRPKFEKSSNKQACHSKAQNSKIIHQSKPGNTRGLPRCASVSTSPWHPPAGLDGTVPRGFEAKTQQGHRSFGGFWATMAPKVFTFKLSRQETPNSVAVFSCWKSWMPSPCQDLCIRIL